MPQPVRIKRHWVGAPAAPASLRSGELAYDGQGGVLYIGKGDDGSGNALSIVAIAGETALATLADALTDIEARQYGSTGLISGGALSVGAPTSTFSIAAGEGIVMDYTDPDNPVATYVAFGPSANLALPLLATELVTYVAINAAGAVVQQATPLTNTQRRSLISLGAVVHSNHVSVNAINTIVSSLRQLQAQFGDGIRAIGRLNLSGNVYAPIGGTLTINKSAGETFFPGVNFHVNPDDPHAASMLAEGPVTFRYRLQNSTEYANTTLLDPNNYDLAGVLTAVPNNKYTVQAIGLFSSGLTRIQYGQAVYDTLTDALNAARAQTMTIESNIAQNGIVRGYIAIKQGTTDAANAATAAFVSLSKFSATNAIITPTATKGTTANRPVLGAAGIGTLYFDTTLDADGKPIWWTGIAWVDATGATV